jgi:hypothetical protein
MLSAYDYTTYRSRPIDIYQKLTPRWACGEHVDHLLDFSQHPRVGPYKIFIVDTEELVSKVSFYGFDPRTLFTGEDASDYRVITTLKRWEADEFVDPPTLSLRNSGRELIIADGRHRTKIACALRHLSLPVAIHEDWVEPIGSIIRLHVFP